MKFVYTEGKYREVNGYVFSLGRPANVVDNATIEVLLKDPTMRRIDDEEERQAPAPETGSLLTHERPILHAKKRGWPLGKKRK